MEHLIKNPVLGAFLNCIAFGLADIYVAHFATGIFKLVLWLASYPIISNYVGNSLPSYYTLWQWGWLAFALAMGYRTVLTAIDEKTPSN